MTTLSNRWILITGASKGLGRAMALEFARAGGNLILTARSEQLLQQIKTDTEALGATCVTLAGDLLDDDLLGRLIAVGLEKKIDVLVNNAGIVDIRPLDEVPVARIKEMIDLNLTAPIRLIHALLPLFKSRRSGTIVNINSAGGKKPVPDHAIYCATKYGLNGLAETLKLEVKGLGIRVVNVSPGKMATELFRAAGQSFDTSAFIPPEEVARSLVSLLQLSPKCSLSELAIDRMS